MTNTVYEPKGDIHLYLDSEYNQQIFNELTQGKNLKGLFEALDFFNLLYEQYDKMINSKEYPSSFYERLYTGSYSGNIPAYTDNQLIYILFKLIGLIELHIGLKDSSSLNDPDWQKCYNYLSKRRFELMDIRGNFRQSNLKKLKHFDFMGMLGSLEDLNDNEGRIELLKKWIDLAGRGKSHRERYFFDKCQTALKCLLFLEGNANVTDYDTQKSVKNIQQSSDIPIPVFKKENIDQIFQIINVHFDQADHPALKSLLESGKSFKPPLLFKGNGATLCRFFDTLLRGGVINAHPQSILEHWIAQNFQFMNSKSKKITPFKHNQVKKYISETALTQKGDHLIEIQTIDGINVIVQQIKKHRDQFGNN